MSRPYPPFTHFSLWLCSVLLLSTIAAIVGAFYPLVLLMIAFGAGVCAWLVHRRSTRSWLTHTDKVALALVIFLGLFHGLFAHDIPQGRDDSVYLVSAIKINESHSLSFTDVLTAPFHGFRAVTSGDVAQQHTYTSQFLPLYSVYLALWYAVGGVSGIFAANSLLIALGLWWMYQTIAIAALGHRDPDDENRDRTRAQQTGLVAILLFATSYLAMWFPRRTVSEHVILLLFWMSAAFFLYAYTHRKHVFFLLGLVPVSLLLLLRAEAIGYVGAYVVATLIAVISTRTLGDWRWKSNSRAQRAVIFGSGVAAIASVGSLFLYTARYGSPYLASGFEEASAAGVRVPVIIVGAIIAAVGFFVYLKLPERIKLLIGRYGVGALILLVVAGELALYFYIQSLPLVPRSVFEPQYVLEQLWNYGLIPFIVVVVIGWFLRVFDRHRTVAFLLLLASPTFLFVIHPGIAFDQPWFMRRFFPILIPLVYGLAAMCITRWVSQEKLVIALLLCATIQLNIAYPLLNFKEHQGIRPIFAKFTAQFTRDDLILMEPGWRWQQWGYGLHYLYHLDVVPSYERLTADELNALVGSHKRVFILMSYQSDYVPRFTSSSNITRMQKQDLVISSLPALDIVRWVSPYVDNNEHGLSLPYLRMGLYDIPPRTTRLINERYDLYQITDPTQIKFTADVNGIIK